MITKTNLKFNILLFFTLAFLISCNSGISPIMDVHVGSDGLLADFQQNTPPSQVYEDQQFITILKMENAGASDIRQGLYVINTQPEYLSFKEGQQFYGYFNLHGRSLKYGYRGESNILTWKIKPASIGSLSTRTTVPFGIRFCYEYETDASPQVCIDTDPFDERVSTKSCTLNEYRSVSAGTQGGPVAVSRVETDILPTDDEDFIIPRFRIYVANVGNGDVIAPLKSRDVCTGRPKGDVYDTIQVIASLGDNPLTCNKYTIKIKTEDFTEDYIECIHDRGISKQLPAYLTPLIIKLKYGYTFVLNEEIEILKQRE